jgi:hypothetical protein
MFAADPLATVDSDFPDDDTLVDFAASQFIVTGQEINWGAIEPRIRARMGSAELASFARPCDLILP